MTTPPSLAYPHEHAARHHKEAAHHAHVAQGHSHHATHYASEAAKSYVERHGMRAVEAFAEARLK
jgi:hypothetical protein